LQHFDTFEGWKLFWIFNSNSIIIKKINKSSLNKNLKTKLKDFYRYIFHRWRIWNFF
jgi:hypothetical protein